MQEAHHNAMPLSNGSADTGCESGPVLSGPRLWVARLALTNMRNYAHLAIDTGPQPVVLVGPNGSGKTNLLEAVSLLAPGQGLRRAPLSDLARAGGQGDWAVAAKVQCGADLIDIGTGLRSAANAQGVNMERTTRRIVRIDGEQQSGTGVLGEYVEIVWVTPAMDGLFVGAASERRRFLDRLILCFDPAHRSLVGRFERAMQSRNRLLADGVRDNARLQGFELLMAEAAVAIAAARIEAVAAMAAITDERRERDKASPFPWAAMALEGTLESALNSAAAVDVEDRYCADLSHNRERDRAAGRTLEGPHRTDLVVTHGPKNVGAKLCSTGEQKSLLVGLVLAHAQLVKQRREGAAPLLLLDEITAHLDELRRKALFEEILHLGAQAWMTGTDRQAFAALSGKASFFTVDDGRATLDEAPGSTQSANT